MDNTLIGIYNRTLNNCIFYENENDKLSLLNEIGVLRGVAYCLELSGECPHDDQFLHFIELQNELKKGL